MTKQRAVLRARAQAILKTIHDVPNPAVESERLAMHARDLALQAADRLLEAEALLQMGKTFVPSTNPRQVWELLHHARAIFEVNGVTAKVLSCRIAQAKILFDMGEERNAILMAQNVLDEPALRAEERAFAHILIAICHSHLGELDTALQRLSLVALPLALLCPGTALLSQVKWAQGLTYIRLYMFHRGPELFRGWADMPAITASLPAPREIYELFDQAQSAMPKGRRWLYLDIGRLLAQGLMEPSAKEVEGLDSIASANLEVDPPLVARTLFCKGLVLRRLGRPADALLAFSEALDRSRRLQSWSITRDVLLNLSRLHEGMGDLENALRTYKEYADLRLRGLISNPDRPSVYLGCVDDDPTQERSIRLSVVEPVFVKRATRFILDNLHRKLAVDDVVEHCGVSRRTLETAFKEAKATTVAHFIKNHKMRNASLALLRTNASVREVSLQFGFHSIEVFSREFRSLFGCSPSRWRTTQPVPTHQAPEATASSGHDEETALRR